MQHMRPSQIRYIQDDVAHQFSNGKNLVDVFKDLYQERIRPEDMGAIDVVQYQGQCYAYDGNRRLLLFKVRVTTKYCYTCCKLKLNKLNYIERVQQL